MTEQGGQSPPSSAHAGESALAAGTQSVSRHQVPPSQATGLDDKIQGDGVRDPNPNNKYLANSWPNETNLKLNDALKPDPGTEGLFEVENSKFAFSPGQLGKLLNPKSLDVFYALGGLAGLEKGLRSDRTSGLSTDETALDGSISFEEATGHRGKGSVPNNPSSEAAHAGAKDEPFSDRIRVYKANRLPDRKSKSILELAWIAYNDKVLILLTIAAIISLALGLYQTFRPHKNGEAKVEWVEGVAIVVAIVIVVAVGALNDWQKERQFVKLSKKKDDRTVKVIRSGKSREISVYSVLVRDVMHLEPGDVVPVDGVFINGHTIKCEESSTTGESDVLRKQGADEVYRAIESGSDLRKLDPFILSGSKVSGGTGTFMVTAVGVNSTHGKTMMSLREETEATPLQQKLNMLAEYIAKLGGAAALLLFVVDLIKFLVQLKGSASTAAEKGQDFLRILIVSVTVVVVAVPEGLPLAVTLALAFATMRMLKDNNLVRVLRSCETMGNATTVCSDKTGTLTQNKMTLVAATVGTTARFGATKRGTGAIGSMDDEELHADEKPITSQPILVPVGVFLSSISSDVKTALMQAIAINSTAFEGVEDGKPAFIGSKTETALLSFARDHLGMGPINEERTNTAVVQVVPFNSSRKCMATVVRLWDGRFRMHVKGASEILLRKCTRIIQDPSMGMSEAQITKEDSEALASTISTYSSQSLRTIAIVYRDFERWPPEGARAEDAPNNAKFDSAFEEMTFLGVVGIKDPLREGVKEAVQDCQMAGVFVRMVTGDNIATAQAIALECGIYQPEEGGLAMEGPAFRNLTEQELDQTIPHLQVLARSSPEDKRTLVSRLKQLRETVAVTGDDTNDAPALKTADVGFSMGIAGTEVAKEASAIILMDDNFSSIVKGIMWGRAVNDAVKKFLQFQITVNITAVVLTFVSSVASDKEESVLSAVQLLWVNLIMDTFAALALATDPPTRSVLRRRPDRKSDPLIATNMWKMIIGQAIYQLAVTLVLNFAGKKILHYGPERERELKTLVFNTFVWMQIFNQYNNRRLDNHFNIFEGVHRNMFFIIINVVMIAGQIMIVFTGGKAFSVTRLDGKQWAVCIIIGAVSIPVAVIIRLIPDQFVASLIPLRWRPPPPMQEKLAEKADLKLIKIVRGGRLNTLEIQIARMQKASGVDDQVVGAMLGMTARKTNR